VTPKANPGDEFFKAYTAAVHAKDLDAFVSLYDDTVRIFDTWDRWSHDGLVAWRTMALEWFGSRGTDRVVVDVSDVRSSATPDMAHASAFLRFTAVDPAGKPLRSLENRITVVLERRGAAWKVVHEHTSAPVNSEGLKAMLKREPA